MNLPSSGKWIKYKIGDICAVKGGKRLPLGSSLTVIKTSHPYIRVTDISDGKVLKNQLQFVSDDVFKKIQRYIVENNDIVISIVGSVGFVALIDEELHMASLTENCVRLTGFGDGICPKFLYYYLISDIGQHYIQTKTVGSTQPKLPIYNIRDIEVPVPSIEEQQEIAALLGCLNGKIELLRKENKTLEAIAQTLFKEWFVDFRYPGATGKMVDSELGPIPEGWRVGTLKDICVNYDSKRIPLASDVRAKRKGPYPYFGATQVMDYIDGYLFEGVFLLLAEDASVMDENGFPVLQYVDGNFWVSNHAHVLQGKEEYSTEMLYLLLKKTSVAGIVTGAVQLKINQENLFSLTSVVPCGDVSIKFNNVISPHFLKIKNNEKEIKSLGKVRDNLLNKIFKS